jgi:rubrerythrin
MRVKSFRLSVLSVAGTLILAVFAGVMCQKQKSTQGETPKAAVSSSMMSTDSMMAGGNTMMADSSIKMTGTAGMSMMADSISKSPMTDYYTCTMHPQVHEAKPGKCPICGMDLVFKKTVKTKR